MPACRYPFPRPQRLVRRQLGDHLLRLDLEERQPEVSRQILGACRVPLGKRLRDLDVHRSPRPRQGAIVARARHLTMGDQRERERVGIRPMEKGDTRSGSANTVSTMVLAASARPQLSSRRNLGGNKNARYVVENRASRALVRARRGPQSLSASPARRRAWRRTRSASGCSRPRPTTPPSSAETAQRQGLFAKEGIKAELTIYRSGGETFEAGAAGAADLQLNSAALVAGRSQEGRHGPRPSPATALGYYGWYLMVKTNSRISQGFQELDGKKVGITSAGSGIRPARPLGESEHKMNFPGCRWAGAGWCPTCLTTIGRRGDLLPALLSDGAEGRGRAPDRLRDRDAAARERVVDRHRQVHRRENPVLQKALNAIYGAVVFLKGRTGPRAVKLIAEIDEIPPRRWRRPSSTATSPSSRPPAR